MNNIRILKVKFEQNYLKKLLIQELSQDNIDIEAIGQLTTLLMKTFVIKTKE
jgi:hypothetical protein